jgi:uncharacterized protein YjbJ (UPF0337 family)
VNLHICDSFTPHRERTFGQRHWFFPIAEFPAWIANTSKASLKKPKGAIKDTAGKVTDDKKLQMEGKFDKAKGSAHNVAGDIKDAVKQSNK